MKKIIGKCLFAATVIALFAGAASLQGASSTQSIYTTAAQEAFATDWVAHENSDLTLGEIKEGGVGTISYYTVPTEVADWAPVNNSVYIPCRGYDLADDTISIKYEANFPTTGQNITVYASLSADVGADGSNLSAEYALIGWFENWNVKTGTCEDGYGYISINHSEYTGSRTIDGVVLQFNYAGDTQEEKKLRLLGVDLHSSAELPVFVTDPTKPFAISNATAEDCVLVTTLNGWRITTTEKGSVSYTVVGWDPSKYDCLLVDCVAFDGGYITPYLDGAAGEPIALSSSRGTLEIPAKVSALSELKLEISGAGTSFVYSVVGSSSPKVVSCSTTDTGYFTSLEMLDDPLYQVGVVRNAQAGWPVTTLLIDNWREEYDIVRIDINVLSGKALAGFMLGDQYLSSHWDAKNMLDIGQHSFTFLAPLEINPNWNGREITLYLNPDSLFNGASCEGEYQIGISFMKSSSLPAAEITVEQESYEFIYDGTKKSISATVLPAGTPYTTTYISGGKESTSAPSAPGEYTVRFEVAGTLEMRRTVKEVSMVIVGIPLEAPTEGEWSFDYVAGTLLLNDGLEASYLPTFDTIISLDRPIQGNSTVYIRRAATGSMLASSAVEVKTPAKPTEKANLTLLELRRTKISVSVDEGVEYRLITGTIIGAWKETGTFIGLEADTDYTIEARVKGTATTFAGDIVSLRVKTLPMQSETPDPDEGNGGENEGNNDGNMPPVVDPTPKGEEGGCSSAIVTSTGAWLALFALVVAFVVCKKSLVNKNR